MKLRPACLNVPALPLQLIAREKPDWKELPAAIVDREEASGRILSINRAAFDAGIRVGTTYSEGLSLDARLRGVSVPADEIARAREEIIAALCDFTPEVEPCDLDEGAFWLNSAGMNGLYPTVGAWVAAIVAALARRGLVGVVVVGFSRFATYLIARGRRISVELETAEMEIAMMRDAAVGTLPLTPAALALLDRLGIERVGGFLDLPKEAVRRRFGTEAEVIFDRARAETLPIQPVYPHTAPEVSRLIDDPLFNLTLLMFEIASLLGALFAIIRDRRQLVASITLTLVEVGGVERTEIIAPATPTRSEEVFKKLVRLRLASGGFTGGVERITISAVEAGGIGGSSDLFESDRVRALAAGARAFSLLRARFGNTSVRRAILRDEHLPERRYAWEPVARPLLPVRSEGNTDSEGRAVVFRAARRVLHDPMVYGDMRPPDIVAGPFAISRRWWADESERSYYFARRSDGQLIWIYRNAGSAHWLVCGVVD